MDQMLFKILCQLNRFSRLGRVFHFLQCAERYNWCACWSNLPRKVQRNASVKLQIAMKADSKTTFNSMETI